MYLDMYVALALYINKYIYISIYLSLYIKVFLSLSLSFSRCADWIHVAVVGLASTRHGLFPDELADSNDLYASFSAERESHVSRHFGANFLPTF